MRLRALKSLALVIPLVLIFSASALADNCNDFATFTCAGNSNIARLGGGTASGLPVGFVLTGAHSAYSPQTAKQPVTSSSSQPLLVRSAAQASMGTPLSAYPASRKAEPSMP